ncbi:hypothetical protein PanWU01x14_036250, partial [Parasponia andersonii]
SHVSLLQSLPLNSIKETEIPSAKGQNVGLPFQPILCSKSLHLSLPFPIPSTDILQKLTATYTLKIPSSDSLNTPPKHLTYQLWCLISLRQSHIIILISYQPSSSIVFSYFTI